MNHNIYCRDCGKIIDPKIIADVHVDGFADDDIICVACTKRRHARLRNLLDAMEEADRAALNV